MSGKSTMGASYLSYEYVSVYPSLVHSSTTTMYLPFTSAVVNLLSLSLLVYASNVVELTPANFDAVVGQGQPALVELCVRSLLTP
jgi:hypothetical protein